MNASILKFLRANGEQLDSEISQALHIPLAKLRDQVAELAASGEVICCQVTRFIDGKRSKALAAGCLAICQRQRRRKPGSSAIRMPI